MSHLKWNINLIKQPGPHLSERSAITLSLRTSSQKSPDTQLE